MHQLWTRPPYLNPDVRLTADEWRGYVVGYEAALLRACAVMELALERRALWLRDRQRIAAQAWRDARRLRNAARVSEREVVGENGDQVVSRGDETRQQMRRDYDAVIALRVVVADVRNDDGHVAGGVEDDRPACADQRLGHPSTLHAAGTAAQLPIAPPSFFQSSSDATAAGVTLRGGELAHRPDVADPLPPREKQTTKRTRRGARG